MLPTRIQRFLDNRRACYERLRHPPTESLSQAARLCGIPEAQVVRALVLIDSQGPLMALLPSNHLLDFAALCAHLKRELEPIPASQLGNVFEDCAAHCCPPLGAAYGLEMLVDAALLEQDTLYIEPGCHNLLLKFSRAEFQHVLGNPATAQFSHPISALHHDDPLRELNKTIQQFTPARIKRKVEEFRDLPALPATAQAILALSNNPRADARDLARVIEQDASLAARVLRYANSPLYGYPGKIKDLQGAIARVLGFDFVLNLALGITVGQSLRIPEQGPLGLQAFWRHSVYAAALVERLSTLLPVDFRPRRGTAYLAGLLHNMGILLLGHAFHSEFFLIKHYWAANPEMPLHQLESYVLGVDHAQIGGWLLAAWGLPAELVTAARCHCDENYWGDHAVYSQLVLIANRLLAGYGIGTGQATELPSFSLEMLGLEETQVRAACEALWAGNCELDALAKMVA